VSAFSRISDPDFQALLSRILDGTIAECSFEALIVVGDQTDAFQERSLLSWARRIWP